MSLEQNASSVEHKVNSALESEDKTASQSLISEVNTDLTSMSKPERDFMENTLALEGLLPDIAIKTGLVTEDEFIDKEALKTIGETEGNSSLKGMAARYLVEHYKEMARPTADINSDYVEGFDLRIDMAVSTAQAMRDFPSLLENANSLTGKESGTENGITHTDLETLLKDPEKLSESERESLDFMKNWFDIMKTPRGVWRATDWSTPRITEESLNEFVDTSVPLGFRNHLEIVQEDYEKHGDLKLRAQIASSQPDELPQPQIEENHNTVIPASDDPVPRVKQPAELPEPQRADTLPKVEGPPEKPEVVIPEDNQGQNQTEQDTLPRIPGADEGPKFVQPDSTNRDSNQRDVRPEEFGPQRTSPENENGADNATGGETRRETVDPNAGSNDGSRDSSGDRLRPGSLPQERKVERNTRPDEFGPTRHEPEEGAERTVVNKDYRHQKFDQSPVGDQSSSDNPQESDATDESEQSAFKTIKLKSDTTVNDFVRSQLGQDASQEDIDKLSKTIVDENDSINGAGDVIKAGDEIKIPKEIELKPVDEVYTVVKGDNLWNISKRHLQDKTGTKPSNREILDQVNKIVERNSIPNPDLIYPDQKIFIPGEVPEEVEPPKEEDKPDPEPEELGPKEELIEKAEEKFGDEPEKLEEFKEDVEAFEARAERDGLPKEEVEATFKEVKRLLDASGDSPLDDAGREKLARQVMDQAAHPTTIDQGRHNTCNMNTIEVRTYSRKPSAAAKVVADVGIAGEYTTKDGMTIKTDATPHGESKSDTDWDGSRTHASEIFQVTTANVYLEQQNQTTDPPGQLRYEQRDSIPGEPRGEGLFDYSTDPPTFIKDSPNITTGNIGKLADVYKSITGEDGGEMVLGHSKFITDTSDSVKRVDSEDGLNEYLAKAKADGNLPIIVAVETTNEPFWTDSGRATAGGSGGGHVVTITDYSPGPPAKVAIDNSWGVDDDHDASDPVDVHELYIAMQRPKDNVSIIENKTKEAREAGAPDHVNEFELLRVNRLLGKTTNDQYTDKLMAALDQAKEDWEAGIEVDGKEDALKKYDRLAGGLPMAQRQKLRDYRESLGL